MSGGSWEYFYCKMEEVAVRLLYDKNIKRRAFGKLMKNCAVAMHDIEWVDSGDCSKGNEMKAIDKCLKFDARVCMKELIGEEITRLEKLVSEFKEMP